MVSEAAPSKKYPSYPRVACTQRESKRKMKELSFSKKKKDL
jgi:hypothetical protein